MKSLYSKLGIAYQQAYSGPYQDLTTEVDGSRLVIARKDGILSGFGRPVIPFGPTAPLVRPFRRLYSETPKVWYMSLDGVDKIAQFLLSEGKIPTPFYTQVISLRRPLSELHMEMRKSYQHLANSYEPIVSVDSRDLDKFKELHIAVCGLQTRSDETWEIQKKMLEYEEAFIVRSPSWNAAGLFIYNKQSCYYGVGKSLGGATSHPVLWRAICHAKKLGCIEFEMGEQIFHGDEKAVNISGFKRGFGGKTIMRLEFKD
jgi:hypothetical protein